MSYWSFCGQLGVIFSRIHTYSDRCKQLVSTMLTLLIKNANKTQHVMKLIWPSKRIFIFISLHVNIRHLFLPILYSRTTVHFEFLETSSRRHTTLEKSTLPANMSSHTDIEFKQDDSKMTGKVTVRTLQSVSQGYEHIFFCSEQL